MVVLGGVFSFRAVAASDMPARQAHTKVYPVLTHFEALLAAIRIRLLSHIHLGQMPAALFTLNAHDCVKASLSSREARISDSLGG
jgi:hypothetical protein